MLIARAGSQNGAGPVFCAVIHASLDRSRSSFASGQNESAPKPGRSQTSTGQTSGSDLGRLDLQELTGARNRNRPGLHRLWDFAHEVDVQKSSPGSHPYLKRLLSGTGSRPDVMDEMKW